MERKQKREHKRERKQEREHKRERNRNTDKDGEKTNEREIQTRLIYKGEKKEKEGIKSLKMGAMLCKTLNNPTVIQPG